MSVFPAVLIAALLPKKSQSAFISLFSREACDITGNGLELLLVNWEIVTRYFYSKGICPETIFGENETVKVTLAQHYNLHKFSWYKQYKYRFFIETAANYLVWENSILYDEHSFYEHAKPVSHSLVVKSANKNTQGYDYSCAILVDGVKKILPVEAKFLFIESKTNLTGPQICKKVELLPEELSEFMFVVISSRTVTKKPQSKEGTGIPAIPVLVLDRAWLQKTFGHISPLFVKAFDVFNNAK